MDFTLNLPSIITASTVVIVALIVVLFYGGRYGLGEVAKANRHQTEALVSTMQTHLNELQTQLDKQEVRHKRQIDALTRKLEASKLREDAALERIDKLEKALADKAIKGK